MEDDKRQRKLDAAKEKLAAYKKRKSQKDAGKISESEPSSFSQSDTSLSLSPLPLSEGNVKKPPEGTVKKPPEKTVEPSEQSVTKLLEQSVDTVKKPSDDSVKKSPKDNEKKLQDARLKKPPDENLKKPPEDSVTEPAEDSVKKLPEEAVKSVSSSISENIELSNSEHDRSLQEIVIANIPFDSPELSLNSVLPPHQSSVLSDSSVISLQALEKFGLENNNFLDISQNVLDELIDISKTDSLQNPFDDLSSITLKSERITGCENKTSQDVDKVEERRKSEEMPYKVEEPVAQNSADVESLKEFNSNQSTLSLGTSTTEYKQYYDKVNLGTIEFQDLLSHRDDHIKQLTEALQQVLEDRNNLQEQTDYFAQEIADLKEQLIQTTEIIKKNNWNTSGNDLISEKKLSVAQNIDETESTSHRSFANELKRDKINFTTDISFDFEDPEFNESMTPEEKKIVADMRNKINLYIQQKVDERKIFYESEMKILRDRLEYEKNLNKKVTPSYKNTEDSVSTLPSMENNDKIITESINSEKQTIKQEKENSYQIDEQMFNESFSPEEINIIADMRTKIYLFIHQSMEKYKNDHEIEIKVLKDTLENEKMTHDCEVDRLRQLLNSVKSGSTEIDELRQELNEQHNKEMEELRTYFEQRCAEIEKHYSEEIFSQQSRKMSDSSISELESEINPPQLGPGGDAPSILTTVDSSPKRDLASLRLELQNKYHAELEILREDYDNRLDELKINHENIVIELDSKYQTLIDALKMDLEEAQKMAVATQEVASSGDFEIAEVVESYERRLQEQVMLAKIDIVSALEQQIQTLVSSTGDELEWPTELLQLRDRLTEHWHAEIRDIKDQHASEIEKLKEDHEKSLSRALERERKGSLKNGDDLDLRKERDNLKKATTNLRHLVAELIKYFTKCEDELNNTLVEELLKYGWDRDSSRVTDSDLNESSQSKSDSEQFDTITISPRIKRVHFTPDVTGIIDLINETTLDNTDPTKDISSEFKTELDLCLSRLKSEANAILSLTSNLKTRPLELTAFESKSAPVEDRISSLTRQLITETQIKNELNIQLDEFKAYIQSLETEKQNLEEQLEQMMDKQQVLVLELDNAKEKISDLIESGRKEIVSEGYGENQIIGTNTLDGRITSLAELQQRARGFLAEADGTTGHPLLQLLDELCTESDKIMEDAKKDHEDLVQQIEAADKKLRATTQFLEEQAVEREAERDDSHKQISALKEQLRDTERTRQSCERINKEEAQGFKLNACPSSCSCTTSSDFNTTVVETVERLEVQMREMTILMSECEVKKTEVENELKEAIDKIWVLRDIVRDLESQIEEKNKTEIDIKNIVAQLEDKINFELKENEELRNKLISLEGCEKESQYQELIRRLESENQKLKVSSELVGPDGVLKQVKSQLSDFEKTLDKRTKDLEALHTVISSTNCSSPSEDMSIRDQIRPPSSSEADSDLPLEQLARLKDKLIRHARAEDAAMKRIRDLEMQLYTAKQDYDEMQSERDVLQEQLSDQLVLISSLQLRLDEQRLRVESAQKQSNASFEHKIYELKNDIQDLQDKIHNRDMIIQDLNCVVEETNKRISEQQKQLSSASDLEKQLVEQFQSEINRLQAENNALNEKLKDRISPVLNDSIGNKTPSALTSEFLDTLLADKNADIDRLKAKLSEIELELKFYASLNLSKEQLVQYSQHVSCCNSKSDLISLVELSEPDQLRRQELSFESIHSASGEQLNYKRSPNDTVFIGSTFRDSKTAGKAHNPLVTSELSTIEKVGLPCVDLTVEEVSSKGSGDSKRVHFDDELEITRLQSKVSELQDEIKLRDKSIIEYQNNLDEIRKKLEFSYETIREKTDNFSDEIDNLKVEKQNLQVELVEVKMHLTEKINKLSDLEKEAERKDKMYMNLSKEKRGLENKIKEFEARIEEFKSYEDLISDKNKEIYDLEQQLAEVTPTNSAESLKESILQKETELNTLKGHIFVLGNKLEDKVKEIEKYYNDYKQLQGSLQEKTELLENINEENKKLITENNLLAMQDAARKKQLQEKLCEHEQKINELEKILKEYREKLESNKQNSDNIKLVSSELDLEIARLKKEVAEKDLAITQNNSLIEDLSKEVHHLQDYLNEKDKIINQMTIDSNSLHVALEAIQTKIQESGNVVDLKKRLREEQNLSGALYEELKYLKQSIEQYESIESTNAMQTLVLLKESVEREKLSNQELKSVKDALLFELESVKQKLKVEEETVQKLNQYLEEEKMNSNMVQLQDANIIESMRIRLEALMETEKAEEESELKYKRMLDEERVNASVIHLRDASTIESLKVRLDDLLKREHDSERVLKIERRIREELERQLASINIGPKSPFKIEFIQQNALENDLLALKNDVDAGHLFGKYLKSESYRKALIFQKRYLLGLLASYQIPTKSVADLKDVLRRTQSTQPISRFRAAVYAVMSISRMQYIVRRWHTGKRIGSTIITKRSHAYDSTSVAGTTQLQLVPSPKFHNFTDRPWAGNSPPCKDRTGRRQDLPLGNAIQESITLAPLQAPALLSQYIERFDSIQQRLGLAIDRSGT